MDRRRDLPPGWRQPPETTAEPVQLRRPYLGRSLPHPDQAPRPRPSFSPRPRQAGQRRVPGQAPTVPEAVRRLVALRRWRPMRAVIGDDIRTPMLWCEFGSCIARYTHPDALGERDLRYRALAAGWRYDALGRLACPDCVRSDPAFWVGRPPGPPGPLA